MFLGSISLERRDKKKGHIFNPIQKFMHQGIDNIVFEKINR